MWQIWLNLSMKTNITNKWKNAAIEASLDTLVGQWHTEQELWFGSRHKTFAATALCRFSVSLLLWASTWHSRLESLLCSSCSCWFHLFQSSTRYGHTTAAVQSKKKWTYEICVTFCNCRTKETSRSMLWLNLLLLNSHTYFATLLLTLQVFSSITNKLQQFKLFFVDLSTSRYRIQTSRVRKCHHKFSSTWFTFNFSLFVIQSGNMTPTGNKGLIK